MTEQIAFPSSPPRYGEQDQNEIRRAINDRMARTPFIDQAGLLQGADVSATRVRVLSISGNPHYLNQYIDEQGSSGWDSGGEITPGAGVLEVDVAAGEGYFSDVIVPPFDLFFETWDADTLTIPNNSFVFIGVSWGGIGTTVQVVQKLTNDWNYRTEWPLGRAFTDDGVIVELSDVPFKIRQGVALLHQRLLETQPFVRAFNLGLIVGETDDTVDFRFITMTEGILWYGIDRFAVGAVNTLTDGQGIIFAYDFNGDRVFDADQRVYATNTTFVGPTIQNQWLFNDRLSATDPLVQLGTNQWSVFWLALTADGDLVGLYHDQTHPNQAQAEEAAPPSWIPPVLTQQLIGKVVFQEGDTSGVFSEFWTLGIV